MSVKSVIDGNLTLNKLNVTTINGSAYPPVVPVPTLSQVLTVGNSADFLNIINVTNLNATTVNGVSFPVGDVAPGSIQTASVPLTSGAPLSQIATIALTRGIWNVRMSGIANLNGANITGNGLLFALADSSSEVYWSETLFSTSGVASSSSYNCYSNGVVVIQETNITLIMKASVQYTGTGISIAKPNAFYGSQYILANKLADLPL